MDKIKQHEYLCKVINDVYIAKNKAYGDAFGKTYQELGAISAVTRMYDKFQRIVTLSKGLGEASTDESMKDTLLDLANYCLMTHMEIQIAEEKFS